MRSDPISYLFGPGNNFNKKPLPTPNANPIPAVSAIAAKSNAPVISTLSVKVGMVLFLAATIIAANMPLKHPNAALKTVLDKNRKINVF